MDIKEITDQINTLATKAESLRDLQVFRAELNGWERPRTYKIFSQSTIFNAEDIYAFHDGGRSELQFNVGVEYMGNETLFRYGLAFSLEPNQSQPDPLNFLTPKIYAFNDFVGKNPDFLTGLSLWNYRDAGHVGRSIDYPVMHIPETWIRWGNFIVIGKYFKKEIEEVSITDVAEIVDLFDYLMPLYKYVETNYSKYKLSVDGDRISRVCWNEYGWVRPSGRNGKSNDPETHEGQYGYGHEEWLGDTSKIIEGYHYGFLESVRKEQAAFVGKRYNIDLFAIDSLTNQRYHVGKITNTEIIDSVQASIIKGEYVRRGWLEEMKQQIIIAGANNDGFSDWNGIDLFNLRFKPEDLHFFSNYLPTNDERILRIKRYTLTYKEADIISDIPIDSTFSFKYGDTELDEQESEIDTSYYYREARPIEIVYLHRRIRDALYKVLVSKYGECISKENPTGHGTLIDLVRKEGERMIFYEIKTYNNIKSCVREAVGQLFEYAFWPGVQNAHQLIIVSQNKVTEDCKRYLFKIRELYGLPIYYQHFDQESNTLSESY